MTPTERQPEGQRARRPRLLAVVTGTGTEVGKTWVCAEVARELGARSWLVVARKPAQSFEADSDGRPLQPTDADILAAATADSPQRVCPPARWYPEPAAPPIAARRCGWRPPTMDDLVGEINASWPDPGSDIALVEGAGGLLAPLAAARDEGDERGKSDSRDDTLGLALALRAEVVVIVADAGLGVIHHTRAATAALRGVDTITVVHLNRYDPTVPTHRENAAWLAGEADQHGYTLSTSSAQTADAIAAALTPCCRRCGESDSDGHACEHRVLDPPRHCPRCGRVVRVTVTPLGYAANCRVHGPI